MPLVEDDDVVEEFPTKAANHLSDVSAYSGTALGFERKLTAFKHYYNDARIHASLNGNILMEAGGKSTTRRADISHIIWQSHCHGLVPLPIAA